MIVTDPLIFTVYLSWSGALCLYSVLKIIWYPLTFVTRPNHMMLYMYLDTYSERTEWQKIVYDQTKHYIKFLFLISLSLSLSFCVLVFNILVNVGVVLTYPILISIGTLLSVPGNAGAWVCAVRHISQYMMKFHLKYMYLPSCTLLHFLKVYRTNQSTI